MKGEWAGGAANIAFPLGDNVFIIARASLYLQMVKIQVTGESSFKWMEAKYHRDKTNYPAKCKDQATFSKDCYDGPSVKKAYYDVDLVAKLQQKQK